MRIQTYTERKQPTPPKSTTMMMMVHAPRFFLTFLFFPFCVQKAVVCENYWHSKRSPNNAKNNPLKERKHWQRKKNVVVIPPTLSPILGSTHWSGKRGIKRMAHLGRLKNPLANATKCHGIKRNSPVESGRKKNTMTWICVREQYRLCKSQESRATMVVGHLDQENKIRAVGSHWFLCKTQYSWNVA